MPSSLHFHSLFVAIHCTCVWQDEHYESGRPYVLATLIPQTTTSEMNFFAYSDFDNTTRFHYTLAAKPGQVQLFTTYIAPNGTSGNLVHSADVTLPADVAVTAITYLFTYQGLVYVSATEGQLVVLDPKTGNVLKEVQMLPANGGYIDSLACRCVGVCAELLSAVRTWWRCPSLYHVVSIRVQCCAAVRCPHRMQCTVTNVPVAVSVAVTVTVPPLFLMLALAMSAPALFHVALSLYLERTALTRGRESFTLTQSRARTISSCTPNPERH